MKEVLDNINNYKPSELEPLGAGEERHLFTRDEFVHEMTVNTAKWQDLMDSRDLRRLSGRTANSQSQFTGRDTLRLIPGRVMIAKR